MLGKKQGGDCRAAAASAPDYWLRTPTMEDGAAVSGLVAACPPLDPNSRYCNLLQCTDFAETCVLAETERQSIGWVSAYKPPRDDSTLFIWQVAVHPDARGLGLGQQMMLDILQRPLCRSVDFLKTTVSPNNRPSRAMFRSLASTLDAPIDERPWFDSARHFDRHHASENLITIGRFSTAVLQAPI